MRRHGLILCLLAACVMASSAVEAISAGPGGRVYTMNIPYTAARGDGSTPYYSNLFSAVIKSDWTLDTTGGSTGGTAGYYNHGRTVIGDNVAVNGGGRLPHMYYWSGDGGWFSPSPEIAKSGGTDGKGYGEVVFSGHYNWPAGSFSDPGGLETGYSADILRLATGQNPGDTVTNVVGNGRVRATGVTKVLQETEMAAPDPKGEFTGWAAAKTANPNAPERYIAASHYSYYTPTMDILADVDGSGDVGDANADYIFNRSVNKSNYLDGNDGEILGNKWYNSGAPLDFNNTSNRIRCVTRVADDCYTLSNFYVSGGPGGERNLLFPWNRSPMAVGKIQGHDAAWARAKLSGTTTVGYIGLFIDLNNDGDAMDNAAVTGSFNEWQIAFSDGDTPQTFDNPSQAINWYEGPSDLEFLSYGGHNFLMANLLGNRWFVIELADNGQFIGGGNANSISMFTKAAEMTGSYHNFEFDYGQFAPPIPEPGTLLLLGTGVLGVFGVIRRRRMR